MTARHANKGQVKPSSRVAARSRWQLAGISFALIALVFFCYWQVWSFEFVNFDDNEYVTHNAWVQKGLSTETFKWAFTTTKASNWHPLTWLSHLLDWSIHGNRAGGHHFTSVIIHCANSVLLFFLLRRITAAQWRSALVAALFAIHPLHVESVAWVAERKDVLSTLLGLGSIYCYSIYASGRTRPTFYYSLAVVLLGLSLMSKPMLVTLPFVLLLLDVWPLQRTGWFTTQNVVETLDGTGRRSTLSKLLVEKIPFLLLSFVSCLITLRVQAGKTMQTLADLSLADRLANVLVSYTGYLEKTFWPTELAFFYPLLGAPTRQAAIFAGCILMAVSAGAWWARRRSPAVLIGWLWYLGTLVPVIGFVHVGEQAMADRYTYIPLIGLFVAVIWATALSLEKMIPRDSRFPVRATSAVVVVIAAASITHRQVSFWRNSQSMLERAFAVTRDNFLAHNNYGVVLAEKGMYDDAIGHYEKAIEIKPHYGRAYSNLGACLTMKGDFAGAVAVLEKALSLRPYDAETHYNMAVTLARQQDYEGTIRHCRQALDLNPGYAVAHYDLGLALTLTGRHEEAVDHFRGYLAVFPNDATAQTLLTSTLQKAVKQ